MGSRAGGILASGPGVPEKWNSLVYFILGGIPRKVTHFFSKTQSLAPQEGRHNECPPGIIR